MSNHVARMEEDIVFKMLTDKPTGKKFLGRHTHRWEDNIRMGLKEIAVNIRNWIDRDYWRSLMYAVFKSPVP